MGANVLIMAGGTGGHVFPALACAREFEARGYTVHWLGTPRGIENELVEPAGFTLHRINVTGLRGKSKLSLLKAPFVLLKALMQARAIIRQLKPVCVLGFGGYVTGPGGLAAKTCGVPVIIHEQNAVAGTANRLLLPMTQRVLEAFPETFEPSDKRRTTGNPVRAELFSLAPRTPLHGRKARLLVLGGSLGAEPLTSCCLKRWPTCRPRCVLKCFIRPASNTTRLPPSATPRLALRLTYSLSLKTWPTLMAGPTWWFVAQAR